jgi:Domain of unknown function (DUF397)
MRLFTPEDRTGGSDEEPAETWRKSSASLANGNCVEVARLSGELIGVRDSKRPPGHVLRFTRAAWDAFLRGVREGEFDAQ